jgi:hypothetical protein
MSVPLRKDQSDENLSTADLAQTKRPSAVEEIRSKPSIAETVTAGRADTAAMRNTDAAATEHEEMATSETAGPNIRNTADTTPLFPSNELDDLRNQWNTIQGTFVDEPRRAVEKADGLVASAMKRLAEVFANERSKLEQQWDRGDNVSTEDLRIALQRYRSFFHRLLSI